MGIIGALELQGERRNYNIKRRAPKGHFVVYVGKELKRFVVPLGFLKSFKFQQLLDRAAEEYGFESKEGIVLPCHESAFLTLTHSLIMSSST